MRRIRDWWSRFWIRRNRLFRRVAIGAGFLVIVLVLLNFVAFPLPKEKLYRPTSTFVYSRDGRLLNCFTSPDRFWRKPVKLSQISPALVKSVLACEDRWFYWHPGVNPVALVQAAVANLRAGRVIRGGSTITMQIARMMEPKERSIPNKVVEILRAFQLELSYSKKELLEIYFNLAPYGGNIEGVGAACYLYFDRSPDHLSLSETAILTALPSSPTQFRPDRDLRKCTLRRDRVLARLLSMGTIDRAEYEQSIREEVPIVRISPAIAAPHFCQMELAGHPGTTIIESTLDYKLQVTCELLARNYQSDLATKGIQNLSAVVLDNRSGDLLAMIGSADFADVANHGQVNGAIAPRSPGSALKPFVYALGFDKGTISPAMKVEDLPINYSGYIPVNYDEQYHGIVSVSEALIQSLNVPAVNLENEIGLSEFCRVLRAGGLSTLTRRDSDYGLPMILGSCEVNLLEISNLYASLARGGLVIPIRMVKSQKTSDPIRLFSPEASYLVTEILAELKRPDLPSSWEFTSDLPHVAWKTGTSFGRKDAWAIGYNPDFTVGVWAGNFSAEGSVSIVGAEAAAPLMFEIFGQLASNGSKSWFAVPPGVGLRSVCALSGYVPNESCPDEIAEHHIIGVSPVRKCGVHRTIMVDKNTGYSLCRYCATGKQQTTRTVEDWSPRAASWLARQGKFIPAPRHNPECRGQYAGEAPLITSPEHDARYVLRKGAPLAYQQILFKASLASDCPKAHWFLDGELYATVPADSDLFYAPKPGKHQLLCVDSYGRSSCLSFEVQ